MMPLRRAPSSRTSGSFLVVPTVLGLALAPAVQGCGSDAYGPRSGRVVGSWELEQALTGAFGEAPTTTCYERGGITFQQQDGRAVSGGYDIRSSICQAGGSRPGRLGGGRLAEGASASASATRFRMAGCNYEGTLSYAGSDQDARINLGEGIVTCDSTELQGFAGTWKMTR